MVEAAVAVGLAARAATNNDIEDLVLATSAEEDQMYFEAMDCLEKEPLRGKTEKMRLKMKKGRKVIAVWKMAQVKKVPMTV